MIDSVFSIFGLDYGALQISDTGLLVSVLIVFLFCMDYVLHFVSMAVSTLTKRR